jgi:hypothetical protein
MAVTVCVGAYSLRFLRGGAYTWMFLNWALGLRALGYEVIWLDSFLGNAANLSLSDDVARLKGYLEEYGLAERVALVSQTGDTTPVEGCLGLEEVAAVADLLINLGYDLPGAVVGRFRRSAFVDIDPGLTQTWMSLGQLVVADHDVYFTMGETVGMPSSPIPTCAVRWHYTPPPVFLPAWPRVSAGADAPYTTVTNWWEEDWITVGGLAVDCTKRAAFLEYLDLPKRVPVRLELAVLEPTDDRAKLEESGWILRDPREVCSTPELHRRYVQTSRGEFSCMKRGYVLLETAWTSERTLNYLASGKPAIIQHTGRSRFLPDAEGLFRFRSLEEAAQCLREAEENYEKHARAARALVEEHFAAEKVLPRVLEVAFA